MKNIGIVRRVDELGRVVLPIELRRSMGINVKDPLEIFVTGDQIVLKKHDPACIFCGKISIVHQFIGKNVCENCLEKLKEIEF